MSAYNPPSQEQSIFNPTNYSIAINKTEDAGFDELTATTGIFSNLLIGSDNVATALNGKQNTIDGDTTFDSFNVLSNINFLQDANVGSAYFPLSHTTITNLSNQTDTNTTNIATHTSDIATLTSQQNTNTSNIATLTSSVSSLGSSTDVPKTYIGSITNHFSSSYTFSSTSNFEFATFTFDIPASTNSSQNFVFETINTANYHAGTNAHIIALSYGLSTDNYFLKTAIRAYRHEGDSETQLIRGVPYISIKDNVGSLGLGSGTIAFTIKLYVSASNHIGSEFKSQYQVATLKLFD